MKLTFAKRCLVIAVTCLASTAAVAGEKPNILFVLADDLAWSDLGCYGHPWHETPGLDQLAAEGMRFTQAYAPAPICSASRGSILTGKTTARLGLEFVVKVEPGQQTLVKGQTLRTPPFKLKLDLDHDTVAEYLDSAGYETAFFGKWHLNPHYEGRYLAWNPTHGPDQQGFEVAVQDFGSHPYSRAKLDPQIPRDTFHTDSLTQKAVGFIKRKHEGPFFLMLSQFYVHTPVRVQSDWLRKKYENKIPEDTKEREKRVEYAAFVETLDHQVGQVLKALELTGLAEKTLVVFTSDNGGHPEYTSNGPLRGSKWNLYEGGIRVPMIARWPGTVKPGSSCETPVIGYDLLPTFFEAAGSTSIPRSPGIDGKSIVPILTGRGEIAERDLIWHFPYYHPEGKKFTNAKTGIGVNDFSVSRTFPQSAIRRGNYKLIWHEEEKRTEVFDLSKDISEQDDLSTEAPDRTELLKQRLFDYLGEVSARRVESAE